jgi:hypothetical protein
MHVMHKVLMSQPNELATGRPPACTTPVRSESARPHVLSTEMAQARTRTVQTVVWSDFKHLFVFLRDEGVLHTFLQMPTACATTR